MAIARRSSAAATSANNPNAARGQRHLRHEAAMNALLNLSILDGWGREGACMGRPAGHRQRRRIRRPDIRDAASLYQTLENEVLTTWPIATSGWG